MISTPRWRSSSGKAGTCTSRSATSGSGRAFRDIESAGYDEARKVVEAREAWTVELLYGDHEGGQRVVSRFTVLPVGNRDEHPDTELRWLATASRHWNIDRPDPR
jgi:hypothetical protein